MAKHFSETFVSVPDAERIAEAVCRSLRDCALSTDAKSGDQVLNFEDGRASVKPNVRGLHIRVEAEDPLTFYGIRSVLQVALWRASPGWTGRLEWHPSGGGLFGVTDRRAGTCRC